MDCPRKGRWSNKAIGIIMSDAEKIKISVIENMRRLCAHCMSGNYEHNCPVRKITEEISKIKGVPLLVNDEFRGIIFR